MAASHGPAQPSVLAPFARVPAARFDAMWPLVPLPLGSDEVYLLGLPWEPWLTYDIGLATESDAQIVLPLLAAVRGGWARARQAARGVWARLAS